MQENKSPYPANESANGNFNAIKPKIHFPLSNPPKNYLHILRFIYVFGWEKTTFFHVDS